MIDKGNNKKGEKLYCNKLTMRQDIEMTLALLLLISNLCAILIH